MPPVAANYIICRTIYNNFYQIISKTIYLFQIFNLPLNQKTEDFKKSYLCPFFEFLFVKKWAYL